MAVIQTIGATEPARVLVECTDTVADVWLRDNIEQDTMEQTQGEDMITCDFYRYDEVHFIVAGTPTVEEIESDFDALWSAHESDGLTAEERIAAMAERIDEQDAALMELGDLLGGE